MNRVSRKKWSSWSATGVLAALLFASATSASGQTAATMPASLAGQFTSGWSLLKEGDVDVSMEQNASQPSQPAADGHLLQIIVKKTAGPGQGRAGITHSAAINVKEDKWYDITFSAMTQTGTVGLVFSLESADGKVLARTTLPEIGRGRGGRGGRRGAATAPATGPAIWPKYLVALHARATAPAAHLVITPIEPTTIWIEALALLERE